MKLEFVTTNKHKVAQAQEVMDQYGITLEQIDMEYEENHDDDMESIAKNAAKKLANELKKPVIVEDTGVYFEAYNNFPGALPKFVFSGVGFEGIFKLLEGKSRKAYFKSIVGYCEPNREPLLFEGTMHGEITREVHNPEADRMPYAHIFVPEGKSVTTSEMDIAEVSRISHRGEAFKKLGEYLKGGKMNNNDHPWLGVDAIIVDDENKILLLKRAGKNFHGMWSLPSGTVEWGEEVKEAVIREVKEETNLDVKIVRFTGKYYDKIGRHPTKTMVCLPHFCKVIGGNLKINSESLDAKWFTPEEIRKIDLAFDHKQMLIDEELI